MCHLSTLAAFQMTKLSVPTASILAIAILALPWSLSAQDHVHNHDHDDHYTERQHEAHIHGHAELGIAVEGHSVELSLGSPLANFLGFEHTPQNDDEIAALNDLKSQMARPGDLFKLSPAAQCSSQSVEIEIDGHEGRDEHEEHGHDEHGHEDAHAELLAAYRFACAAPQALNDVKVMLFTLFPHFEEIDAVILTDNGQTAQTLSAGSYAISLK